MAKDCILISSWIVSGDRTLAKSRFVKKGYSKDVNNNSKRRHGDRRNHFGIHRPQMGTPRSNGSLTRPDTPSNRGWRNLHRLPSLRPQGTQRWSQNAPLTSSFVSAVVKAVASTFRCTRLANRARAWQKCPSPFAGETLTNGEGTTTAVLDSSSSLRSAQIVVKCLPSVILARRRCY